MSLKDDYTTQKKIDKDETGKEEKKTTLSEDAFALCEFIELLTRKIEQVRINMLK